MCNLRSLHESLNPIPLLPQAIHTPSFQSGWVSTLLLLHCYTTLLLWWINYWHRCTTEKEKKKKKKAQTPRLQLRSLLALDIKDRKILFYYFNPQIWGPAHKALSDTRCPLYTLFKQTIMQMLSSICALLLHSCLLYKSLFKGGDTLILRAGLPDRYFKQPQLVCHLLFYPMVSGRQTNWPPQKAR